MAGEQEGSGKQPPSFFPKTLFHSYQLLLPILLDHRLIFLFPQSVDVNASRLETTYERVRT